MDESCLRVTPLQYDIAWEDKEKNMVYVKSVATELSGDTDLLVLPEMSFTGFTMNMSMAELPDGELLRQVKNLAVTCNLAICGSVLIKENDKFYNRAFFITPNEDHFYDKRHLFRMGREGELMTAGHEKKIFHYKGFNICLQVCYDLRFPVWSRNIENQYDLLIYVANWPKARKSVWEILLRARAIENMCYVCGVNRVGVDGNGLSYSGDSMLINERGELFISPSDNKSVFQSVILYKASLTDMRRKFPVWKDADVFEVKTNLIR